MSADERPRVMIDGTPPDYLLAMLNVVELVPWQSRPTDALKSVTGIFTYEHPPVDGPLIDAVPNCRVVSNHGVGVDHIDLHAATERGIRVGHTPDVLNGAVADHAFALLLAAARRLPESIDLAAAPDTVQFDQSQLNGWDVHGAVLGILGLGRIGVEIARRAAGFGMQTIYHNRRPREDDNVLGVQYVTFERLLSDSDFLVIATPLNEQTRGMIGASELHMMKPSAIIVNVARGAIVDTDGVVQALREGAIRGAALDVTDPEPLPRGHELLRMPNAIVTSHIGSATLQTRQKMAQLAVDNLMRGLRGEQLRRAAN